MAEIPLQHKHERALWPWMLALLALVLVIWFLFGRRAERSVAAHRDTSVFGGAISNPADSATKQVPR